MLIDANENEMVTAARKYAYTLMAKGMHEADAQDAAQDFLLGILTAKKTVNVEQEGASTYLWRYGKGYAMHAIDKKAKWANAEKVRLDYASGENDDLTFHIETDDEAVPALVNNGETFSADLLEADEGATENLSDDMKAILETLPDREKDMVIRHAILEESLTDIGKEYSITKERVRQIVNAAYETLRNKIAA